VNIGFAGGIATIYDGATCPSTQTLLHTIFCLILGMLVKWNSLANLKYFQVWSMTFILF